jgi:hypothetical protein
MLDGASYPVLHNSGCYVELVTEDPFQFGQARQQLNSAGIHLVLTLQQN